MPERHALVTGATGFIASHLVPALVADGWEVRACGRRPRPGPLPSEAEYRSVDLVGADDADLAALVDGVTHVFHLAGASSSRSSEEEMRRDNGVATERLFDALVAGPGATGTARKVERALHMSTTAVYGEDVQLPSPVPEDVEPHPSRGYGKAKWEAEEVVWRHTEAGFPAVVVRPVSVHGPGAIKLLASAILDVAVERFMGLDRLAVPDVANEQRLVHVDDLVAACLHLAVHPDAVGRAFNVGSGVYPTSHEIAGVLSEHFGMTVELDPDPECGPSYDERRRAWSDMVGQGMDDSIILTKERFRFMRKENRNNRLSLDALRSTGFEPRHIDIRRDAVADAEWYRDHRWVLGP